MFSPSDYNYELPPDLIAQKPSARRDRSMLLCLNRQTGGVSHHRFYEISDFLEPGDVLVLNDTAVVPGRLEGKRDTGGKVEVLIIDYPEARKSVQKNGHFVCRCLVKTSKRPVPGMWLYFEEDLKAEVLEGRNGTYALNFHTEKNFENLLERIGKVPLPPYIHRINGRKPLCDDRVAYQTVYAAHKGAIAAPTAGLHLTTELLDRLNARGIKIAPLTLHVGYGTFVPIRVADIRRHQMHAEQFALSAKSAAMINAAKSGGKRVVAVGTTCVRTLEYISNSTGRVAAASGRCDLFIYPGYRFKLVDALITNFHLPKSSLVMLVSAFAGRENVLRAYQEAIQRRYRFFSYGDAMLIV